MKIAFFSNFLNHHQLHLCNAFLNSPQVDDFKFIACEEISSDRISMGYEDMNTKYDFVVRAYEDEEIAIDIAKKFDVVIFGAAPVKFIQKRMEKNLLSFRYSERPLKKGAWRRFIPRTAKKIYEGYTKYKNDKMYILCASSYTASDLKLCGFDKNKCFKWGYFPQIEKKDIEALLSRKKQNVIPEILYAGRLVKWKRVLDTVKAVHKLVNKGIAIHFTIIGEGECYDSINSYIIENKLEDYITMLPFTTPENVRTYMDKADIYVLGSDYYEGWGAVVNEAMNSACAVVTSHAVGSSKYLIRNGENGFTYNFGNVNELAERLSKLAINSELRQQIGLSAYETVSQIWNAQVAVERFINICMLMEQSADFKAFYNDGPCSMA